MDTPDGKELTIKQDKPDTRQGADLFSTSTHHIKSVLFYEHEEVIRLIPICLALTMVLTGCGGSADKLNGR